MASLRYDIRSQFVPLASISLSIHWNPAVDQQLGNGSRVAATALILPTLSYVSCISCICIKQHRYARSPNRDSHMAGPLQSAHLPDNLALHALDEKGQLLFLEEGSEYTARKNSRRSQMRQQSVA
jgi:hypothetical protein